MANRQVEDHRRRGGQPHLARATAERDFHNARYGSGQDTRAHLDKFYFAISQGDVRYRELVRQQATRRSVLEYGCADGTSAILEMKTPEVAAHYHGIDIADESIRIAREKADAAGYANCSFETMDAEAMRFPGGSFDLIYGHGILHHLDLDRSFAELRRTLKRGGVAVFMEPLGHNRLLNWYRARTPELRTPDEHPLVAEDFELAARYFEFVDVKFFGLATSLAIPLRNTPLANASLSVLGAVDTLLCANRAIGLQAWYALIVLRRDR